MAPVKPPPKAKRVPKTDAQRIQEVLDDIVPFALTLQGVEESTSYGQPSVKRDGKWLFGLRKDLETVSIRCGFERRETLLKERPEMFFITDHYINYPACVVQLAKVNKALLRKVVKASWEELGEISAKKVRGAKSGGAGRNARRR